MRNRQGFLDINDYIDLGFTQNGVNVPHWLSNTESKYVFKELKGIRLYRELVYPIILRKIKMNAVENDLAVYHGKQGILSKSYHLNEEKVLSLSNIIKQYCNDVLHKKYYEKIGSIYNVENLNRVFKWYSMIHNLYYDEQTIQKSLLLDFFIQILLANDDNAPINKEAYVGKIFKLSPYFDF